MKKAISIESCSHAGFALKPGDKTLRQEAFETRARASLADYRRSGVAYSVDEVFEPIKAQFKARRAELRGD